MVRNGRRANVFCWRGMCWNNTHTNIYYICQLVFHLGASMGVVGRYGWWRHLLTLEFLHHDVLEKQQKTSLLCGCGCRYERTLIVETPSFVQKSVFPSSWQVGIKRYNCQVVSEFLLAYGDQNKKAWITKVLRVRCLSPGCSHSFSLQIDINAPLKVLGWHFMGLLHLQRSLSITLSVWQTFVTSVIYV